jgi:hypothetical protein
MDDSNNPPSRGVPLYLGLCRRDDLDIGSRYRKFARGAVLRRLKLSPASESVEARGEAKAVVVLRESLLGIPRRVLEFYIAGTHICEGP